jgi:arginyl-tRNA synthetase
MMALNGNTATYVQYAYARVRSIFRKGEIDPEALRAARPAVTLGHPTERALGLLLLRWPETIEQTAEELKPNVLTDYLFALANAYSTFYDACPVLKADEEATRASRLALCDLTARTLERGLRLLGIEVAERM